MADEIPGASKGQIKAERRAVAAAKRQQRGQTQKRRPRAHRTQFQVQDEAGEIVAVAKSQREADALVAQQPNLTIMQSQELVSDAPRADSVSDRLENLFSFTPTAQMNRLEQAEEEKARALKASQPVIAVVDKQREADMAALKLYLNSENALDVQAAIEAGVDAKILERVGVPTLTIQKGKQRMADLKLIEPYLKEGVFDVEAAVLDGIDPGLIQRVGVTAETIAKVQATQADTQILQPFLTEDGQIQVYEAVGAVPDEVLIKQGVTQETIAEVKQNKADLEFVAKFRDGDTIDVQAALDEADEESELASLRRTVGDEAVAQASQNAADLAAIAEFRDGDTINVDAAVASGKVSLDSLRRTVGDEAVDAAQQRVGDRQLLQSYVTEDGQIQVYEAVGNVPDDVLLRQNVTPDLIAQAKQGKADLASVADFREGDAIDVNAAVASNRVPLDGLRRLVGDAPVEAAKKYTADLADVEPFRTEDGSIDVRAALAGHVGSDTLKRLGAKDAHLFAAFYSLEAEKTIQPYLLPPNESGERQLDLEAAIRGGTSPDVLLLVGINDESIARVNQLISDEAMFAPYLSEDGTQLDVEAAILGGADQEALARLLGGAEAIERVTQSIEDLAAIKSYQLPDGKVDINKAIDGGIDVAVLRRLGLPTEKAASVSALPLPPTTIQAQHINRLRDVFGQAQQAVLRGVSGGQDTNNAQRLASQRINEFWREHGYNVAGMRTFYMDRSNWFGRAEASAQSKIRNNDYLLSIGEISKENHDYRNALHEQRIIDVRRQRDERAQALRDFDAYVAALRPFIQETIVDTYPAVAAITQNLAGATRIQEPSRTTPELIASIEQAGGFQQAIATGTIDRTEAVSLGATHLDVDIAQQSVIPQAVDFAPDTRFQLLNQQGESVGFTSGQAGIDVAIAQGFTVQPVTLVAPDIPMPTAQELRQMDDATAEAIRITPRSEAQLIRTQDDGAARLVSQEEFERYQASIQRLDAAGLVEREGDAITNINLAEARVRGFGDDLEALGFTPAQIEENVAQVRANAQAAREYRAEVSNRLSAVRELQRVAPHTIVGSGGVDLAVAHIEGLDRLSLQAGYTQADITRANQQRLQQYQTQAQAAQRLDPWLSPEGLDVLGAVESGVPRETFIDYGLSPDIYTAAVAAVEQYEFPGQRLEAFSDAITQAEEELLGEPYIPALGDVSPDGQDLQREALLQTPVQDVFDAETGQYLRTQSAEIGTARYPRAEVIGETISKATTPLAAGFAQTFPGSKPEDYSERLTEIQDAFFAGRLSLTDATKETQLLLSEVNPATRIAAETAASVVLFSPLSGASRAGVARFGPELRGGPGVAPIQPGFSRPVPVGEGPLTPTSPFGPRLIPSAVPGRIGGGTIPGRVGGGAGGAGEAGGIPILTRGPGGTITVSRAELLPPALRPNPVPAGSTIRIGAQGQVNVVEAPLPVGRLVLPSDVPRVQGLSLNEAVGVVRSLSGAQQILFLRGLTPTVAVGVVPFTTVGQALPVSQRQAFISAIGDGWRPVLKPDGTLLAVEAPTREPETMPAPDIAPVREPDLDPDFDPLPSTEPDTFDPFDPRTYPKPLREPEVVAEPEIEPEPMRVAPAPTVAPKPEIPPDIIVRPARPTGPEVLPVPVPAFRPFPEDVPFTPELSPFLPPGVQPIPAPGIAPSEVPEIAPIRRVGEPDIAPFQPFEPEPLLPAEPGVAPMSPFVAPVEPGLAPMRPPFDPAAPFEPGIRPDGPFPATQPLRDPTIRPDAIPVPRTLPQPDLQPQTLPFPETVPQPDLRPLVEPQIRPEPLIVPQKQPQPQAETMAQPQVQPQPKLEPRLQPQTQPQPATQPLPEVQPFPETQPFPQVQPAPQTLPQVQPFPAVQPAPAVRPVPGPVPPFPVIQVPPPPTPPPPGIVRPGGGDEEQEDRDVSGTRLRKAGINRGFLDTTVDFTTGEVETVPDLPNVPEIPTRQSFTPLSYDPNASPSLQRIPWGANDLILGPRGSFKWVKANSPLPKQSELLPADQFGKGNGAGEGEATKPADVMITRSPIMKRRGRGL